MNKNFIPAPPKGDDWVWYNPSPEPHTSPLINWRIFKCWDCDVTWKQYYEPSDRPPVRCWCCGKFQPKPKF